MFITATGFEITTFFSSTSSTFSSSALFLFSDFCFFIAGEAAATLGLEGTGNVSMDFETKGASALSVASLAFLLNPKDRRLMIGDR
ncbi:hypothetical protein TL16_g10493 [Triparma laevis f. inornata]|uniref:Uncharacterized protein n=1 Tax=Triparma laevis f. inornata TaxID=1714386 RepID=A0A9W7B8M9_9STRA|nr:hypothetical protein TL16_g10493 [Triparma laevis f. inornata]